MKIKTRLILVAILLAALFLGNALYNPTYEISSPDGRSVLSYNRHDMNPKFIGNNETCNFFELEDEMELNLCNEAEQ